MTNEELVRVLDAMDEAGFTQHERNNERLRLAVHRLMNRKFEPAGQFVRHSSSGPWIEVPKPEPGSEVLYRRASLAEE